MKKNLNTLDRIVRLLIVALIAILFLSNSISGNLALVLGGIAIILAATAIINFCPLYYVLHISTKKKTQES